MKIVIPGEQAGGFWRLIWAGNLNVQTLTAIFGRKMASKPEMLFLTTVQIDILQLLDTFFEKLTFFGMRDQKRPLGARLHNTIQYEHSG